MPRGKLYDDDDFDDGYDDDDYDGGDYDDWDDAPATQPAKGAPAKGAASAGGKKAAPAPAKAPAATAVKKDPAAAAVKVPGQAQASSSQAAGFDFSTPSPDAQVLAARSKQGGATGTATAPTPTPASSSAATTATKAIHLAPSKAMLAANKQLQNQTAARTESAGSSAAVSAASGAADALQDLKLAGGATAEAAGAAIASRKRMAEFMLEPALAKECERAVQEEQAASSSSAGGAGSRPGLHLVVLGHVDAGKSTLMGRLLHDLGLVSSKEVHKNQRDAAAAGKGSFSWAWLLDERPQERARGVTTDVATSRFATSRYNVTLLDAPGHKDFVPNMISGASQADAALLVVDGSPGGFESGFEGSGAVGAEYGQTREHAQLARSLGVEQLTVVITKLDMAGYDPMRFAHIQSQLSPFLASCGFKESSIQWLPAVGPEGVNLVAPPAANHPLADWWQGATLTQAIDSFKPRERLIGKPVRVPVTDVFKNKAGVSVVGGKLEAGVIKPGSKLVLMPGAEPVTVKAVEVDGQSCSLARAGDAVELALVGPTLDLSHLHKGSMLCHPDYPVPMVTKFEARVLVLDVPIPLLRGQSVTLHAHVVHEAGVVTALVASLNAKTGEVLKAKPRCLTKGQSALVEVTLGRPMCLEEYSDLKALGRVTLRDGGRSLALGVITRLIE